MRSAAGGEGEEGQGPTKRTHGGVTISDRDLGRWANLQGRAPDPGQRYRHYKGQLYEVVTYALAESNCCEAVVYRDVNTGVVWVRSLHSWLEPVMTDGGQIVPRFARE